jgi:hypothetical protein
MSDKGKPKLRSLDDLIQDYARARMSNKGPGAPRKWPGRWGDDVDDVLFCYRVWWCREALAKERGCGVEAVSPDDACQRLLDENPDKFRTKKGAQIKASSLRNRYNEARRRLGFDHALSPKIR